MGWLRLQAVVGAMQEYLANQPLQQISMDVLCALASCASQETALELTRCGTVAVVRPRICVATAIRRRRQIIKACSIHTEHQHLQVAAAAVNHRRHAHADPRTGCGVQSPWLLDQSQPG